MLFSSIVFIFFFLPITLAFYYLLPTTKIKNTLLLFTSLLFYAWGEPKYIIVMMISIFINYISGLYISKLVKNKSLRLNVLIVTILLNLSFLFVYKYLGFSIVLINHLFEFIKIQPSPIVKFLMPIGISFYTFQSISYIVDVYRKPGLVQKNIVDLGLYISFFPQLIAGPIVRFHDINYQIKSRFHSLSLFSEGMDRFIVGLSKKVLLANVFGEVADGIYILPNEGYSLYYSWIAAISYSFQIYYDFSGYSDMAIGLGKMFGFHFQENFNYPYFAKNITDFWRRWHISLSSWFKDYVYIPLGGNRNGKIRTTLNLFTVFFITGIWHGASINFILWGLGHGTLLFIEKLLINTKNVKQFLVITVFSRIYTLLSVILLWVFFRNGTKNSIKILLKMFGINFSETEIFNDPSLYLLVDKRFYIILILGVIFSFPWWQSFNYKKTYQSILLQYLKKFLLLILFILSVSSLANNTYNPFIYFRF